MADIRIVASGLGFPEGPGGGDGGRLGDPGRNLRPQGDPGDARRLEERDRQGRRRAKRGGARPRRGALCLQQWGRRLTKRRRAFCRPGRPLTTPAAPSSASIRKPARRGPSTASAMGTSCRRRTTLVFDKAGGFFYFTDLGKRYPHNRDNGGLYYALPDGSAVTELVYPIITPNGVGLSAGREDRLCRRHRKPRGSMPGTSSPRAR